MNRSFDVIVAGASVSGAALAIRLGRAGIHTALVDRSVFPRAKPCGEGLSSAAFGVLTELGVLDEIAQLPHGRYRGYRIWDGDRSAAVPAALHGDGTALSIAVERTLLDDLLCTAALRESSVTGLFGIPVRSIERGKAGVSVAVGEDVFHARIAVIADGNRSPLAEDLGLRARPVSVERFGASFHARGHFETEMDEVHVILEDSYELFITRVASDAVNISVLADKGNERAPNLRRILSGVPELLRERFGFEPEACEPALGATSLASTKRATAAPGVLLIGDACETLDPIAGMGMTHALFTASAAAEALVPFVRGMCTERECASRYTAHRGTLVREARGFTRAVRFLLKELPRDKAFRILESRMLNGMMSAPIDSFSARIPRRLLGTVGLF